LTQEASPQRRLQERSSSTPTPLLPPLEEEGEVVLVEAVEVVQQDVVDVLQQAMLEVEEAEA
jgi:hypothetical protein